MAYNVFISYSTKNLHIVQWAVNALTQPGHIAVFAAEYAVQPSQVLNAEIERAIRGCDLVILLWSNDARASDYVPQEIGIAKGCNKVILPVVVEDGVKVPGFISDLKYLPAHKDWDGSFVWLTNFVRSNADDLAKKKILGGIAVAGLAGIALFNRGDDEDDYDDEEDDE